MNLHRLPKLGTDNIYYKNGYITKYTEDKEKNTNIYFRSIPLSGWVPKITKKTDNTITYEYVSGTSLYDCPLEIQEKFLYWCKENLWQPKDFYKGFPDDCQEFYYNKTLKRINLLNIDNSYFLSKVENLLNKISIVGTPCIFHGDLQFDNSIYTGSDFKLIDWREKFGSNHNVYGDLYYDLAKLHSCLNLSHRALVNGKQVELKQSLDILKKFILDFYGLEKVLVLSSLVYINMAPLHPEPIQSILIKKFLETSNDLIC